MPTRRLFLVASLFLVPLVFAAVIWWSATQNELVETEFATRSKTIENGPKTVSVDTAAEIEFTNTAPFGMTLKGNEDVVEAVRIREENDTLRIEAKPETLEVLTWDRSDLVIVISTEQFPTTLEFRGDIFVSGTGVQGEAGRITSEGQLDGLLTGIETETLEVELVGTGNLELTGETERSRYSSEGTANLDARDLTSGSTTAEVEGEGIIRTRTTEQLQAQVNGSGAILYTERPAQLQSQVNGSGSVEESS